MQSTRMRAQSRLQEEARRPFEVIPAIDLRGGRVVRLRRGDFGQETVLRRRPGGRRIRFANAGARWIHVVDLDGAREGRPAQRRGRSRASSPQSPAALPAEVAGGLRTRNPWPQAIAAGAARSSWARPLFAIPTFAGAPCRRLWARPCRGRDRCSRRAGGRRRAGARAPRDAAARGRDRIAWRPWASRSSRSRRSAAMGSSKGPTSTSWRRSSALDLGAVIASGGISSLADLRAVADLGCAGAIVGRALYEGRIDLRDAIELAATVA